MLWPCEGDMSGLSDSQAIKMVNNYYARLNHNMGVPVNNLVDTITLYTVQANYILLYTQQARKLA